MTEDEALAYKMRFNNVETIAYNNKHAIEHIENVIDRDTQKIDLNYTEQQEQFNIVKDRISHLEIITHEMLNGIDKIQSGDITQHLINYRTIKKLSGEERIKFILELPYESRSILLLMLFDNKDDIKNIAGLVKTRKIKFCSISQYYDRLMISMILTNMLYETNFEDFEDTLNIFTTSFQNYQLYIYDAFFNALLKVNTSVQNEVEENIVSNLQYFNSRDLRSRLALVSVMKNMTILNTYFDMSNN